MASKTERVPGHPGIYRRGKSYLYVVRDQNGKQRWVSGFPSIRAAKADRDKTRVKVREGEYVAPTSQTFAEFTAEWLESRKPSLRPSTLASYADLLRDHVNPRIGNLPLQKVRADNLDKLYGELLTTGRRYGTGGLSPRTVRYVHTVVRAALQTAYRWGRVPRNEADRADPPEAVRAEAKFWPTEVLREFLLSVKDERLASLYYLAAMTGMRRGEVVGLRWSDVDLDGATLRVAEALILVEGRAMLSTPKTEAGARELSLDPRTVEILRAHRRAQRAERLKAGPAWQDCGRVFTREDGRQLDPDWVTKSFTRATKRLGLPHIPFHGLRHSHATALLEAGVDTKVASKRIGHSSVRITADVYQHVQRGMDKDAASAAAALVLG